MTRAEFIQRGMLARLAIAEIDESPRESLELVARFAEMVDEFSESQFDRQSSLNNLDVSLDRLQNGLGGVVSAVESLRRST